MPINQLVSRRIKTSGQTDLCDGQTIEGTEADGLTDPLWQSDRPPNRG
jgi:hypothetical protein